MSGFANFPRISPFLWFDSNAEEAVDFYLSVFSDSRIIDVVHTNYEGHMPLGSVLTIAFELEAQKMTALNGGPYHKFNEAISLFVRCDSQAEVDFYWEKLLEGGKAIQCGWLTDKFGLCWQIIPARLPELIRKPKAMQAMMKMVKIDLAELERAAAAE